MVPNNDLRLCLCAVSVLVTEPVHIFMPVFFLQCGIIPTSNTNREIVLKWVALPTYAWYLRYDAPWEPPIKTRKIPVSKDASFAPLAERRCVQIRGRQINQYR
jgi:hypothetical protein